jgi:RNA polymerase sigma-70 factor (ECF subfamily)
MSDAAAFGEFYATSYRGLVAELYAYTGNLSDAQEAAQEAYLRAWKHWRRVNTYEQPRAWVRRVGYRIAVDRWRKARTALASWRRHGPPPAVPELDAVSHDLVAALRQLPESQRRALVMHHMGGLSVSEIAATEEVAEGTVKARLSRGRAALAKLLTDDPMEVANDV